MPRYGPGQSGPPPRARARPPAVPATTAPRTTRADVRATTTVPPAPRQQTRPRQAAAPHLSERGYEAQSRPRVRGMVASGNIDLNKRPIVHNRDGSYSTVRSISVGVGKHTFLIPTVVGRRVVSNEQAFNYFKRTGQHLGIFDTYENADRYAETLHEAQAREYGQRADASPDTGARTTRADVRATTTVKPAPRKTPAQGGAVLRRGTFQPENRKQQAELAQGVRQNAAEQQRQQRQQRLKVAYGRLSVRREQARQRGDAAGIVRYDKHLTALEPHLEAAGLTPKPSKFLDSAYGAVQRAEKVPVAGELLGMVDPIALGKSAVANAKALPDIGTKKFHAGEISAGVAFGKGGEFAKGPEEAAAAPKAPDYHGHHQPPDAAPGSSMDNPSDIYPADLYSAHGARVYGSGGHKADIARDRRTHALLRAVKGKPDAEVTVYRAVPKEAGRTINPGDWVTPSKSYARMHGQSNVHRGYVIASRKVRARDLYTEGNSLHEWGWHPKQEDAAAAKVRASLGPARARRAAQEGLYREERGKRIGRAQSASERAGGGEAGFAAAKNELRGELPKVKFEHLREGKLSEDDYHSLMTQIQNHPGLGKWDRLPAQQALQNAFREGVTPQKAQIRHLETVFGQDAVKEILHTTKLVKAGKIAINVGGIPRSLMASYDISAPGRQGLIGGAAHPVQFAKTFKPMGRSLVNETKYAAEMAKIRADPDYERFTRHGLNLTDLSGELGTREEPFPSSYAEKIPVVGRGVRASGRAYTGFLDVFRMKLAKSIVAYDRKRGVNTEDRAYLKKVMGHVNMETGRGRLGPVESWGPALNALFFSPRLAASRVEYLIKTVNPVFWAKASPGLRREMLRSYAGLGALVGGSVGTAKALGVGGTSVDPRSADFLKLKIGNTRLDLLGGISQYIRLAAEEGSQSTVSSTTGKVTKFGSGFAQRSGGDILVNFLAQKLAPTPSFLWYASHGKNYAGQPFNLKSEIASRVAPLSIQDAISTFQQTGSMRAAIAALSASSVGVGVQSYSGQQYINAQIAKTKKNHDEYGKKILEGAIKTGLLPKGSTKLTPQLTKALTIRTARYVNREKLGASDTRSRFAADVKFLEQRKIIDKAKGDHAIKWAKGEKRDYLVERELHHLSTWYFDDLYGNALADARQKLRDKGYDLPRTPR